MSIWVLVGVTIVPVAPGSPVGVGTIWAGDGIAMPILKARAAIVLQDPNITGFFMANSQGFGWFSQRASRAISSYLLIYFSSLGVLQGENTNFFENSYSGGFFEPDFVKAVMIAVAW
jgi:hypothetical protein